MSTTTVTIEDGSEIEVEAGRLLVPESRTHATDRVISIPYRRLRSTSDDPAPPIFLLAGGPGSSWIDLLENQGNFKEVQFYRTIADVVLFDQRGGGHSLPAMECEQRGSLSRHEPLQPGRLAAALRAASSECRDEWTAAGIDLSAYTTIESAADVDALREALGYKTMSLIGGSYGSHLALALMRYHPHSIERVVMYGVEGLDHTWDDPAGRLGTLERIAAAAEASEQLGPHIPPQGLLRALRTVIERLEREPVRVAIEIDARGDTVIVDAALVRLIAGHQAGRKSRPNAWPEMILDMHDGDYALLTHAALSFRDFALQDPMHYMMDCASGISPARAARYRADPASELLGDINFEYEAVCDAWGAPDLGPGFRAPLESEIPTVIVHGTWDTSTPIENAREVVATLLNGQLVEVIGGTHGALYDLYNHWPPMYDTLAGFLRGQAVRFPATIRLPEVQFEPRASK